MLFWRPLTAWAERFRLEESEAADSSRAAGARPAAPLPGGRASLGRALRRRRPSRSTARMRRVRAAPSTAPVAGPRRARRAAATSSSPAVVARPVAYGLVARCRLHRRQPPASARSRTRSARRWSPSCGSIVLVAVATVVWVPIGVWIGFNPRVARLAAAGRAGARQLPGELPVPVRDRWSSWPPGISLNCRRHPADGLGAQWYILFNVDRRRHARSPPTCARRRPTCGVRGWLRWRRLILPAIFPAYVTGGITAAGGAWNASIVAEIVTYGGTTLTATGLGAYIAQATATGDFAEDPHRRRGHERLRRRAQPAVLAAAVRPVRAPLLPLTALADRSPAMADPHPRRRCS